MGWEAERAEQEYWERQAANIPDEGKELAYLKFIRDTVFKKHAHLQFVIARKYPKFGTIYREEIEDLIAMVEDYGVEEAIRADQHDEVKAYAKSDVEFANALAKELKDYKSSTDAQLSSRIEEPISRQMLRYYLGSEKTRVGYDPAAPNTFVTVSPTGRFHVHEVPTGDVMKSAEFYRAEAEMLLERARKVEGIPTEDIFDGGQVLTFEKKFPSGSIVYRYAAIKHEGVWTVTGNNQANRIFSWSDLVNFVGMDALETIKVVTEKVDLKEYAAGLQRALDEASTEAQADGK